MAAIKEEVQMEMAPPSGPSTNLSSEQKHVLNRLLSKKLSIGLHFDCTAANLARIANASGFTLPQVKNSLCTIASKIKTRNILQETFKKELLFDPVDEGLIKVMKQNVKVFVRGDAKANKVAPLTNGPTNSRTKKRTASRTEESQGRSAKKPRAFNTQQRQVLEASWKSGQISLKEKRPMIAALAGLDVKQVNIWLANKKAKSKAVPPKPSTKAVPFVKSQRLPNNATGILERAFERGLLESKDDRTFAAIMAKISVKQVNIWNSNKKAKLKRLTSSSSSSSSSSSPPVTKNSNEKAPSTEPKVSAQNTPNGDDMSDEDTEPLDDVDKKDDEAMDESEDFVDDQTDETFSLGYTVRPKDDSLLINQRPRRTTRSSVNYADMDLTPTVAPFNTGSRRRNAAHGGHNTAKKRSTSASAPLTKKKVRTSSPSKKTVVSKPFKPFASEQRRILENAFQKKIYEDRSTHELLAGLTGLEKKQVTRWFVDRRRRPAQPVKIQPRQVRAGQFHDEQKKMLEFAFQNGLHTSKDQIKILVLLTDLQEKQVKRWFVDRRRRKTNQTKKPVTPKKVKTRVRSSPRLMKREPFVQAAPTLSDSFTDNLKSDDNPEASSSSSSTTSAAYNGSKRVILPVLQLAESSSVDSTALEAIVTSPVPPDILPPPIPPPLSPINQPQSVPPIDDENVIKPPPEVEVDEMKDNESVQENQPQEEQPQEQQQEQQEQAAPKQPPALPEALVENHDELQPTATDHQSTS